MIADSLSVHFVLGSKLAAERHLKDFHREMIHKNFCVLKEEEGAPLQAALDEFLELALFLLMHLWSPSFSDAFSEQYDFQQYDWTCYIWYTS